MTQGSLHPRRIEAALDWLVDHHGEAGIPIRELDTCVAALKLIQKTQAATGITAERVDVGAQVLTVLDYVKSTFKVK